ncbi:GNAT family N-acetyltransferase [Dysgonomonas mossii]|uniref:GNAT family N-acetyltransferase n=1 Tax=Dysgonomonas mossii TaxID=163665 RepID=A0A4Y9IKH7_9BACT|nr:GNAT family N-acetyltransferase [Dysgonomonas mossii]MBF0762020.1 GNAT family N-acetyltransferase [Dysgonomonas mossii]TFU88841.1 GNAT family N-acetyltransferase [Dysgonomonas mossii]
MNIRLIEEKDNEAMARIIQSTLEEFGANQPGTVYYDQSIWSLSDIVNNDKSAYFVIEENNKILGGAGIYPTQGLPEHTAELVKLYTIPETRGKGYGKQLINICLDFAKQVGYKYIYLESMEELSMAVGLYERLGFKYLDTPMGKSGHNYCKIWMLKDLGE